MSKRHSRLRLRTDQWDVLADAKGWTTMKGAATALGIADTTLSRVYRGETDPGDAFLRAVVEQFPNVRLSQLFYVVPPADARGELRAS
jgi:hypothetical protein